MHATSDIPDREIIEAARRAFPHAERFAIEEFRVVGNSAENEIRLYACHRLSGRRWSREMTGSSRVALLLALASVKPAGVRPAVEALRPAHRHTVGRKPRATRLPRPE